MAKIDAILNLVWALLCIGALATHFWRERMGLTARCNRAFRWKQTLSVLVAAVALFPVISASDDRVRLAEFQAGPTSASHQAAFHRGQMDPATPSAPLEDPENAPTAAPILTVTIICFFLVVSKETSAMARWFTLSAQGRAPPALA